MVRLELCVSCVANIEEEGNKPPATSCETRASCWSSMSFVMNVVFEEEVNQQQISPELILTLNRRGKDHTYNILLSSRLDVAAGGERDVVE